ncbi:MAG: SGNH/GDSL hydrolase family protein [Chloroflexota bacterium]|nr:SGNH/GDSL hydrolase family protein [Chloroflexota bacterium]
MRNREPSRAKPLAYVALGDSYTIGTGVGPAERWPDQLVARVGPARLRLAANLGVNGSTSGDVIRRDLPQLASLRPGFASLLIGVNDVVQGISAEVFRDNAARILDALLDDLPANRILVVSTPDYTLTPAGARYGDPDVQRARIVSNNAVLADLAGARGIAVVDIFDLSGRVRDDPSLVADDGLHPGAEQYRLWVDRIAPQVERLIRD